jgi:hypothetical protein
MFGRGPQRLLLALVLVVCCTALAPALANAAEPGAIEGTVTEAVTGTPIEAAEVRVGGPDETTVLTDGAGHYKVEGLTEGIYEVDFTGRVCTGGPCATKYAERFYDEVKPYGTPTPVVVEDEHTTEEIDAELELDGAIKGKLADPQSAPIANGLVCVNSTTEYHPECVVSDSSGEYEFPHLPPGEFNIQFTGRVCAAGSACDVEACALGEGCPRTYIGHYWEDGLTEEEATLVPLAAGEVVGGKDATLAPGGEIKGKVTVAALGAPPLAGFIVCASAETRPAVGECVSTDASGEYAIEGLDESDWLVEFKEACPGGEPCPGTYRTQFYPGKADAAEATLIALKAPEVKAGIDAGIVELTPQTPSFVTDPVVTGIPVVSRTLTCAPGTWAHNPTALRYAWLRTGIRIAGAESHTYTTTATDAGEVVTCEVTIENSAGSVEALSNEVTIGPEVAPAFTTQPALSGDPAVGSTLTCTEGVAENYPTSTSFAWLRDGTAIPGQAGDRYNVTRDDEGALLTCRVTMSNGAGAAHADSNGLTVPAPPEEHKDNPTSPPPSSGSDSSGAAAGTTPTTTEPPKGSNPKPGTATAAETAAAGRSVAVKLTCSDKGDCRVKLKLTAKQKGKQFVIGSGTFTIAAGKTRTIALPLNSAGEKLLAKAGKAGLQVKLTGSGVKPRTLIVK